MAVSLTTTSAFASKHQSILEFSRSFCRGKDAQWISATTNSGQLDTNSCHSQFLAYLEFFMAQLMTKKKRRFTPWTHIKNQAISWSNGSGHQFITATATQRIRRGWRWVWVPMGSTEWTNLLFFITHNKHTWLVVVSPPLWKMMEFVNWDDDRHPIFLGKFKKWQPNHQPDTNHASYGNLKTEQTTWGDHIEKRGTPRKIPGPSFASSAGPSGDSIGDTLEVFTNHLGCHLGCGKPGRSCEHHRGFPTCFSMLTAICCIFPRFMRYKWYKNPEGLVGNMEILEHAKLSPSAGVVGEVFVRWSNGIHMILVVSKWGMPPHTYLSINLSVYLSRLSI